MIVLDSSGLFAAFDASQAGHRAARAALEADPGPRLISPFVLAEVDYLVLRSLGTDAELVLLEDVAKGSYRLEPFGPEDVAQAVAVIDRYRDLRIGLADASIVVLAARHGTNRVLTLDERHFRAVRPLRGRAFEIVPADA